MIICQTLPRTRVVIKKLQRAVPALALSVLPLLATVVPAHAADSREALTSTLTTSAARESASLFEGIDRIRAPAESREGYVRTAFRHWNAGRLPDDGCNTRAEVLLEEAVEQPEILAPGCKLTGGRWFSPYDDTWVTAASGLDVDHLVPLAESWDSGASAWTAKRREAYANDQATPISLIAATAKSNRAKADKDPAEWLPPTATYHCALRHRLGRDQLHWSLSADDRER